MSEADATTMIGLSLGTLSRHNCDAHSRRPLKTLLWLLQLFLFVSLMVKQSVNLSARLRSFPYTHERVVSESGADATVLLTSRPGEHLAYARANAAFGPVGRRASGRAFVLRKFFLSYGHEETRRHTVRGSLLTMSE